MHFDASDWRIVKNLKIPALYFWIQNNSPKLLADTPTMISSLLSLFLQKLIKELPSLVPGDDGAKPRASAQRVRAASLEGSRAGSPSSIDTSVASSVSSAFGLQQHGDKTTEAVAAAKKSVSQSAVAQIDSESGRTEGEDGLAGVDGHANAQRVEPEQQANDIGVLGRSPGEVAFFKLLHTEYKKATHFFERAQQEFVIREERVRKGMEIMKQPNSIMVSEKWSLLAKSLYRLYKDLLLLETFAIMTYCSFSKILKKHDKVTGYNTRRAFMANVVNKANFTNYPLVLEMISRCEHLYEEVSGKLLQEGKQGLFEDERLFINMIHRLNEQCMDTADGEGVPERKEIRRSSYNSVAALPGSGSESKATSSLRSLVEENDKKIALAQVSEGAAGDDCDCDDTDDCSRTAPETDRKRSVAEEKVAGDDVNAKSEKRQRRE